MCALDVLLTDTPSAALHYTTTTVRTRRPIITMSGWQPDTSAFVEEPLAVRLRFVMGTVAGRDCASYRSVRIAYTSRHLSAARRRCELFCPLWVCAATYEWCRVVAQCPVTNAGIGNKPGTGTVCKCAAALPVVLTSFCTRDRAPVCSNQGICDYDTGLKVAGCLCNTVRTTSWGVS